jgi:hypothetical protein
MKQKLYLVLALSIAMSAQSEPTLYHREYNEKQTTGKALRMVIREVERTDMTSTLMIDFTSGASVPSVMAITRACYDIAKARNKKYFINLKEWEDEKGRWHYLTGFSDKEEPSPLAFFKVNGSDKKGDQLEYSSVKEYDRMFGVEK